MELEQIKIMIERALTDGILSRAESEAIKAAIYFDKKVTPQEAQLLRELHAKIWHGEIHLGDD